jgi:protein-lysine N-methyltransferase EEF2KMT
MELGIGELVSIYSELCGLGSPPPVIDADDLQQDPEVNLWLVNAVVLLG